MGSQSLTFRQPRLQYGQGIHGFFCQHRGNQFVSSALMLPMTGRFTAGIRHDIDTRRLDLVRFARGQSKDQVARDFLAGKSGGDQILVAGADWEKTRVRRTARRRDPATGRPYPWLYQEQAMAGHWYFYGFDADFGPFHIKFCGYFPYTGQIYLNGHEYAKQQCRKDGIAFTALDNAFGTASDPAADPADLRRAHRPEDLPVRRQVAGPAAAAVHPRRRGRRLPLAAAGRADRVLHHHDPGPAAIGADLLPGSSSATTSTSAAPDKVNLVVGRMIRQRGKYRTPGTFRTQVITTGTCPCPCLYLYLHDKKTHDGQYLKEGRALRTETTAGQPRDLGIGKELTNLAALAEAGYSASRRLLDAECISHDPAAGTAALEMLTSPVISTTCTRVPGLRFPDPRVQALLAACCALALRPAGFTSRDLRHLLAPPAGKRSRGHDRRPDQL